MIKTQLEKVLFLRKISDMSTIEIRERIISQLANIHDTSFLKAIMVLIDSKVETDIYKLSDDQKERIRQGREQLKNGLTLTHEEMQKEIDQWLGSK